jgi:hypothetical protein
MNDRVVVMVGVGENLDLFTKKNTPYSRGIGTPTT